MGKWDMKAWEEVHGGLGEGTWGDRRGYGVYGGIGGHTGKHNTNKSNQFCLRILFLGPS